MVGPMTTTETRSDRGNRSKTFLGVCFAVLLSFAVSGTLYYQAQDKKKKNAEIVANLRVLENLDILMREDFDKLVAN